ncbi:MAG: O-acetyl-ADP-ribose deacetylase [Candidatus Omnitrophica bacterium]|nr:O-acetyl-ADP-ribose deacetylase [Candidatus Omnitrophota bacterium]
MIVFEVVQGDITKLKVDALVNAANTSLLGGGGVDGAIHRAAGSELLDACRTLGGCSVGDAKITNGFQLSARHVIHTVGPIWRGGQHNEEGLLANCYRRAIEVATQNKLKTIAFPCVSTGVYRFPKALAAQIAVDTVYDIVQHQNMFIAKVIFVCFDLENFMIYQKLLSSHREKS